MLSVSAIAQVCHAANRELQILQGDPAPSPAWDDAPEWQRVSAVQGVSAALEGVTAEELHERWCSWKREAGWVYGPVKDATAKTHPCLVPYADLDEGQQTKDHVFAAIVTALAGPVRE